MNVELMKTVHGVKNVEMVVAIFPKNVPVLVFMTPYVVWMVEPTLMTVRLDVQIRQSDRLASVSQPASLFYARWLVNTDSPEMTMAVRSVDAKKRLYVEVLNNVDNLKNRAVRPSVAEVTASLNALSMNAPI
jgi:hypothetical protein